MTDYSAPYSPLVTLTAGKWSDPIPWLPGTGHPGGPMFSLGGQEGRAMFDAEFSVSGIPRDPALRDWSVYVVRVRVRDGVENETHKRYLEPPRRGSYVEDGIAEPGTWITAGETWYYRAKLEADKGVKIQLRPVAAKGLLIADYVAEQLKVVRR